MGNNWRRNAGYDTGIAASTEMDIKLLFMNLQINTVALPALGKWMALFGISIIM